MPKKLSTNTKAVEARERKAEEKKTKSDAEERMKEDAKWVDDDKSLAKKQDRKQDEERKKAEALRKKAEAKLLLEQEEEANKIEKEVEQRNKAIENINNPPKAAEPKVVPLEENLNHVMADVHVASSVDQAISVLKVSESDGDRHPEKRMKAAYRAYEDSQFPIIKAQNPSLKLSQLKQIIFKDWQKSPENPINRAN